MTRNLKATYEKGKLRLKEPLLVPDGTQVEVTVILREEDNGERSLGMGDQSWEALSQLLAGFLTLLATTTVTFIAPERRAKIGIQWLDRLAWSKL